MPKNLWPGTGGARTQAVPMRGLNAPPLVRVPVPLTGLTGEVSSSGEVIRNVRCGLSKLRLLGLMRVIVPIGYFVESNRNSIHAVSTLRNRKFVSTLIGEVARRPIPYND